MSQVDIYKERDRAYSAWHRRDSIKRYIPIESAELLNQIDMDNIYLQCGMTTPELYIEYSNKDKRTALFLVEAAIDVGQSFKPSAVTAQFARDLGIRSYTVLYTRGDMPNPADVTVKDIIGFRCERLTPTRSGWSNFTPYEWAWKLLIARNAAEEELYRKQKLRLF